MVAVGVLSGTGLCAINSGDVPQDFAFEADFA